MINRQNSSLTVFSHIYRADHCESQIASPTPIPTDLGDSKGEFMFADLIVS